MLTQSEGMYDFLWLTDAGMHLLFFPSPLDPLPEEVLRHSAERTKALQGELNSRAHCWIHNPEAMS